MSGRRIRGVLAVANNNVMALYLWHMVPVVVVAAIALSTMICNDLVMPVLLRIRSLRLDERGEAPERRVQIGEHGDRDQVGAEGADAETNGEE